MWEIIPTSLLWFVWFLLPLVTNLNSRQIFLHCWTVSSHVPHFSHGLSVFFFHLSKGTYNMIMSTPVTFLVLTWFYFEGQHGPFGTLISLTSFSSFKVKACILSLVVCHWRFDIPFIFIIALWSEKLYKSSSQHASCRYLFKINPKVALLTSNLVLTFFSAFLNFTSSMSSVDSNGL